MFSALLFIVIANFLVFALHLENTHSFPKQLTEEQEREYFKQMANGDKSARGKLIEHNLRLIAHIVKKYYSAANETDDLISIGTIGLIKAVNTFTYDKGTRFATYASRCIENEILMQFRVQKKSAGDIYFGDAIDTDGEGNALTLSDIIADEQNISDLIGLKIDSERLGRYIKESLTFREQQIVKMRYGLTGGASLTQREVAKKLNISRSYVSRIETRSLSVLKKRFEKC